MQVVLPKTGEIVAKVNSTSPEFAVKNLAPGSDYVINIYSVNKRGRSNPYLVEGFSLKVAENRMGK